MHRSKTAHELLKQIAVERESDIIVISEQYRDMTSGWWLEDPSKTAAIWKPRGSSAVITKSGCIDCCVYVTTDQCTILSCYLTPSDGIDEF